LGNPFLSSSKTSFARVFTSQKSGGAEKIGGKKPKLKKASRIWQVVVSKNHTPRAVLKE